MGLDMYLIGEKDVWTDFKNPKNNPMEDGFPVRSRRLELGYWRKHPDLHGYILQEFAEGIDECQEIHLQESDVEQIVKAIKEDNLPQTEGFFFGSSSSSDYQNSTVQLEKALKWLKTEEENILRSIIYQASW